MNGDKMTVYMWISLGPLLIVIIGAAIGFGSLKQIIKSNTKAIECISQSTAAQEIRIQKLEDKLQHDMWSDEKLRDMIQSAVRNALLEVELKWTREGLLHSHRRKTNEDN